MTDENKSGAPGDQGQQPTEPVPNQEATQPVPPPPSAGQQPQETQPVPPQQQPTQEMPGAPGQAQPTEQMPYGQAQPTGQAPYGQAPYGQQPPMGQPGYYDPSQPAQQKPGSGKAMGALICGIAAIFFSAIPFVGIILGIIAVVLASQYVKTFGKESKATGGKITGIIGIVFSVLAMILYIMLFALGVALVDSGYDDYDSDLYEYIAPDTSTDSGSFDVDAEEAALEVVAQEELERLTNLDSAQVEELTEFLDTELTAALSSGNAQLSFSDFGVDSADFATWWVTNESASVDAVYAFADDDATASLTVVRIDEREFTTILQEEMDSFLDSTDYSSISSDKDLYLKIGEYMKAAMEKTPTTETYLSLEFEKINGEWVVIKDSFDVALYNLYGYEFSS